MKDTPHALAWRTALLIVFLACAVGLYLFWPTVSTMIEIWAHSRTFAHGFLVLPAGLYLIWCYRERLAVMVPNPSLWGLAFLFVVGGGWLLGYLTKTLLAQQMAVVAMLPALVWAILGTAIAVALLFPLGFLAFALPVGTSLEPWLQDFTAAFIVSGLQLVGTPVIREGYFITIPSRVWEVAADCGGLRYVLPGLALGYLYAAVMYRHWLRRLGFLLLTVMMLILANGFRAYAIILGDHMGIAEGADHRVFSYIVYGITIVSLFWLGLKCREAPQAEQDERAYQREEVFPIRKTVLAALGAIALLALAPLSAWLLGGPR